jgi:hypothetical protein
MTGQDYLAKEIADVNQYIDMQSIIKRHLEGLQGSINGKTIDESIDIAENLSKELDTSISKYNRNIHFLEDVEGFDRNKALINMAAMSSVIKTIDLFIINLHREKRNTPQ